MLKTVAYLPEGYEVKIAILCGQLDLLAHLDYRFNAETVPYEVYYGDYFYPELLRDLNEVRQACHCSVLIHDLDQHASGAQSGKTRQVHSSFCVACPPQNAL